MRYEGNIEEDIEKRFGRETVNRMLFISFTINMFGEFYKLNKQEGYRYLKKYGGLTYLRDHWWALHTDNFEHIIRELFDYCKRNGGYMT